LPLHKIYVEVFGGAASVLLAKPPSQIEVYNDRDGALVNLFETLRNHPLLFLERCEFLLYSRELYQRWGSQLKNSFRGADIDRITSGFVGDPTKGWAFDRSGSRGGAADGPRSGKKSLSSARE
jgi:DNA adenine methylase